MDRNAHQGAQAPAPLQPSSGRQPCGPKTWQGAGRPTWKPEGEQYFKGEGGRPPRGRRRRRQKKKKPASVWHPKPSQNPGQKSILRAMAQLLPESQSELGFKQGELLCPAEAFCLGTPG